MRRLGRVVLWILLLELLLALALGTWIRVRAERPTVYVVGQTLELRSPPARCARA